MFAKKSVSTDPERDKTVPETDGEQANVRTLQIEINGLKELVQAKDQTIEELRARIADLQKTQQLLTYYQAPLWERMLEKWRGSKKGSQDTSR